MATLAVVAAADLDLRARIVAPLAECGLTVVAAAGYEEALAAAPAARLLVGVCDPDSTAQRTALRQLARRHEELRIIVVCATPSGGSARLALERWIDGFVFVDQLGAALAPTAAAVLVGQAVVPRRTRMLRHPTLSFREKQILALVVLGYTNGQIGARLFLAESTVKSHLSSSFAKLGVRSRSAAAALVLEPEESSRLGIDRLTAGFDHATIELAGAGR